MLFPIETPADDAVVKDPIAIALLKPLTLLPIAIELLEATEYNPIADELSVNSVYFRVRA
jgi:hypothetical protein